MNKKTVVFLFAALLSSGYCQEGDNARGIVLMGSPEAKISGCSEGVCPVDLCLPGPLAELEKRLSCFTDAKNLTREDLLEIKRTIAQFYADYNHPFVRISFPKQSLDKGALKVVVEEATIGRIEVAGNKHFSSRPICRYLRAYPSGTIDTKQMLSDINFINRNPFRRVDVVYAAGMEPGTTDITLAVRDRATFRLYAGYDNTGVDPLGTGRFFTGLNWANVFNLDHILSFQYSVNPEHPKQFQSVSAHYTAPLSWRNTLVVYGGYSWIVSPNTPGYRSNGQTAQASLRYQIPLPSTGGLLHEAEWGGDWKWTNNQIQFNAASTGIERYANLFQFQAGYNLDYQTPRTNTTFDVELFGGPGRWLPHQSEDDYFLLRADSKPSYFYFRSTFSEVIQLPKEFTVWTFLRGQAATANLLPSEQTGLGGYDTVRGYEERACNVDNAFLFNFELRSPTIVFGERYRLRLRNELTLLAFFDYGYGANHEGDVTVAEGFKPTVWLAGAGPGVRWNIDRYFSLRYDWGVRINREAAVFGSGWQHSHFAFTASY